MQIAKQVVNVNPTELRLPSRAWKVKLVGEGADDAGGVFDDTVTEMCQVILHIILYCCTTGITAYCIRLLVIPQSNYKRIKYKNK